MGSLEPFLMLWRVAIAVSVVATFRVLLTGRSRFPFLTIFLIADTIHSILLFWLRRDPPHYTDVYMIGGSVLVILQFGGVFEAFRRLIEHYPNFRRIGIGLFIVMALIAAIVALGSAQIVKPGWDGRAEEVIQVARTFNLGLAATLLLLLVALPRYRTIPVRPIAYLNAGVWISRFAISTAALSITEYSAGELNMLASWMIIGGLLLSTMAWGIVISPKWDYVPEYEHVDPAESARYSREARMIYRMATAVTRCKRP